MGDQKAFGGIKNAVKSLPVVRDHFSKVVELVKQHSELVKNYGELLNEHNENLKRYGLLLDQVSKYRAPSCSLNIAPPVVSALGGNTAAISDGSTVRKHLVAALSALDQAGGNASPPPPVEVNRGESCHDTNVHQMGAQYELLTNHTLWVDSLKFGDNLMSVRGWAIVPLRRGTIKINGTEATRIQWGGQPDDLGTVFSTLPTSVTESARFRLEHRIDPDTRLVQIEYLPRDAFRQPLSSEFLVLRPARQGTVFSANRGKPEQGDRG